MDLDKKVRKINSLKFDFFPLLDLVNGRIVCMRPPKPYESLITFIRSGPSEFQKEKISFQILISLFMVAFLELELFDFSIHKIFVDPEQNVLFECFQEKKNKSSVPEMFDLLAQQREGLLDSDLFSEFTGRLFRKKKFAEYLIRKQIRKFPNPPQFSK